MEYCESEELKYKIKVIDEQIAKLILERDHLEDKLNNLQEYKGCTNSSDKSKDFITPPEHVNFHAKKLFENPGDIIDGAVAYIDENGGGPLVNHVHNTHNHLFIMVKGQAKIILDNKEFILNENESFLVDGSLPHSVWNNISSKTIMIGLTVKK